MTDDEKYFMTRLNELTRETGIAIFRCRCCGSPRLMRIKSTNGNYEYWTDSNGRIKDISWLYNVDADVDVDVGRSRSNPYKKNNEHDCWSW